MVDSRLNPSTGALVSPVNDDLHNESHVYEGKMPRRRSVNWKNKKPTVAERSEQRRRWLELQQPWMKKRRERSARRAVAKRARANELLRRNVYCSFCSREARANELLRRGAYAACCAREDVDGARVICTESDMSKQRGGGVEVGIEMDAIVPGMELPSCREPKQVSQRPNQVAHLAGPLAGGGHDIFIAAETNDDGACGLHASWGVVVGGWSSACQTRRLLPIVLLLYSTAREAPGGMRVSD